MRKFSNGNKLLSALLSIAVMSWLLWSALSIGAMSWVLRWGVSTFTAKQEIQGLPGGDIQRSIDDHNKLDEWQSGPMQESAKL